MFVIAIPAVSIGSVRRLQPEFLQVILRSRSKGFQCSAAACPPWRAFSAAAFHSGSVHCLSADRLNNSRRISRMIRGMKFVSIPVRNQDASLKFFTEKLGFKVGTDQPFSEKQLWIELLIPGAETGLVLFTPDGHENRIGDFQPISFWCDDVFATAKIMKSKGVEFAADPKTESWGTSAIFKDVDGNKFVLSSK